MASSQQRLQLSSLSRPLELCVQTRTLQLSHPEEEEGEGGSEAEGVVDRGELTTRAPQTISLLVTGQ